MRNLVNIPWNIESHLIVLGLQKPDRKMSGQTACAKHTCHVAQKGYQIWDPDRPLGSGYWRKRGHPECASISLTTAIHEVPSRDQGTVGRLYSISEGGKWPMTLVPSFGFSPRTQTWLPWGRQHVQLAFCEKNHSCPGRLSLCLWHNCNTTNQVRERDPKARFQTQMVTVYCYQRERERGQTDTETEEKSEEASISYPPTHPHQGEVHQASRSQKKGEAPSSVRQREEQSRGEHHLFQSDSFLKTSTPKTSRCERN